MNEAQSRGLLREAEGTQAAYLERCYQAGCVSCETEIMSTTSQDAPKIMRKEDKQIK